MHDKPMAESDGTFLRDDASCPGVACRKCGETGGVKFKPWESSCGGYEDYKYTCTKCGHYWWIEGSDA